jgi:hypothetical protein
MDREKQTNVEQQTRAERNNKHRLIDGLGRLMDWLIRKCVASGFWKVYITKVYTHGKKKSGINILTERFLRCLRVLLRLH